MSTIGKDKQLILSVTREQLFGCFLQYSFNGFVSEELFVRQMNKLHHYNNKDNIDSLFSERGPLEIDVKRKQIIPYVVIGSKKNETLLSYIRPSKGNEERLHGRLSIGFGGHIEPQDAVDAISIYDVICNCAKREVKEELSLWAGGMKFETLGFINDDTDQVGKVHFGVVLYLDVSEVPVDDILKMLTDNTEVSGLNFRSLADLQNTPDGYEYETWSKHVLTALPYIDFTV